MYGFKFWNRYNTNTNVQLASIKSTQDIPADISSTSIDYIVDNYSKGSSNFIDYAKSSGVKQYLFISSAGMYKVIAKYQLNAMCREDDHSAYPFNIWIPTPSGITNACWEALKSINRFTTIVRISGTTIASASALSTLLSPFP